MTTRNTPLPTITIPPSIPDNICHWDSRARKYINQASLEEQIKLYKEYPGKWPLTTNLSPTRLCDLENSEPITLKQFKKDCEEACKEFREEGIVYPKLYLSSNLWDLVSQTLIDLLNEALAIDLIIGTSTQGITERYFLNMVAYTKLYDKLSTGFQHTPYRTYYKMPEWGLSSRTFRNGINLQLATQLSKLFRVEAEAYILEILANNSQELSNDLFVSARHEIPTIYGKLWMLGTEPC